MGAGAGSIQYCYSETLLCVMWLKQTRNLVRYYNSIIASIFEKQDSQCGEKKKYVTEKELSKNAEVLNPNWKY